jgi:glycosyltransferase involved in cell wall biosynthesis
MNNLKVSIFMLAYNHEDYIETAIESILMQKVNFNYRLYIGEDCSTDRTRKICLNYKKKYSDRIELILHDSNIGPSRNAKIIYNACSTSLSKYVAVLEADDYWNDVNKLQTQVDFLDQNENFIGCFHNTEERFENSDNASFLYCKYPKNRAFSFFDLCIENIVPTCSILFRNNYLKMLPDKHFDIICGDWALHLFNLQFGNYWYISKVMGVHRYTNNSIWSGKSQKKNELNILETYDNFILTYSSEPQKKLKLIRAKKKFYLKSNYKLIRLCYQLKYKILKNKHY